MPNTYFKYQCKKKVNKDTSPLKQYALYQFKVWLCILIGVIVVSTRDQ